MIAREQAQAVADKLLVEHNAYRRPDQQIAAAYAFDLGGGRVKAFSARLVAKDGTVVHSEYLGNFVEPV